MDNLVTIQSGYFFQKFHYAQIIVYRYPLWTDGLLADYDCGKTVVQQRRRGNLKIKSYLNLEVQDPTPKAETLWLQSDLQT